MVPVDDQEAGQCFRNVYPCQALDRPPILDQLDALLLLGLEKSIQLVD